jgi:hypothetical protein
LCLAGSLAYRRPAKTEQEGEASESTSNRMRSDQGPPGRDGFSIHNSSLVVAMM